MDGRQIAEYLEAEEISGLELSKRAGVKHEFVYGVASYDQQTLPADVVRKLAKAMGVHGYDLAPALAIYRDPDGEEVDTFYGGAQLGVYGGESPEDVAPLPE